MQAFIKITVNSAVNGVRVFHAVRMELVDSGIKFYAGGYGYWFSVDDVISIEPEIA